MILCYGQEIVTKILTNIHVWKCTGDFKSAKEFSDKHSQVSDFFLKIRQIIIDSAIPRRLELYHNIEMDENNQIKIKTYSESLEGIINSFVDRYNVDLNKHIYQQWTKYDTQFFPEK